MGKVILNLAQTIDGYICRHNGKVDYLDQYNETAPESFQKFLDEIDVIVMGRTTYDEYQGFGFDLFASKTIVVWTTREGTNRDNVRFYTGPLQELLKEYAGDTIWCFGGTKVIESFMKENAIDEYHITTVPYLLGTGKPLFTPGAYEQPLKLHRTIVENGLVTTIHVKENR